MSKVTIKVKISTPKGQATKTARMIEPYILPRKTEHKLEVNAEDNEMVWVVNCDIAKMMKIQRNVSIFDTLVGNILASRKMRWGMKVARVTKEQLKELDDMLKNHTKVEIIEKNIEV